MSYTRSLCIGANSAPSKIILERRANLLGYIPYSIKGHLLPNKLARIFLMVRKWLTTMLVILIALQSVVAIADVHQTHQTGTQHLEYDQDHRSHSASEKQTFEKDSNAVSEYDCHHCCHCHGMAHFFLPSQNNSLDTPSSEQRILDFRLKYPSAFVTPDLRPPIA